MAYSARRTGCDAVLGCSAAVQRCSAALGYGAAVQHWDTGLQCNTGMQGCSAVPGTTLWKQHYTAVQHCHRVPRFSNSPDASQMGTVLLLPRSCLIGSMSVSSSTPDMTIPSPTTWWQRNTRALPPRSKSLYSHPAHTYLYRLQQTSMPEHV